MTAPVPAVPLTDAERERIGWLAHRTNDEYRMGRISSDSQRAEWESLLADLLAARAAAQPPAADRAALAEAWEYRVDYTGTTATGEDASMWIEAFDDREEAEYFAAHMRDGRVSARRIAGAWVPLADALAARPAPDAVPADRVRALADEWDELRMGAFAGSTQYAAALRDCAEALRALLADHQPAAPVESYNRDDGLSLLPEYEESGNGRPVPGTWSAGWAVSFGCQVSFGPDPDGVLRAVVHVSDRAKRDGVARREITTLQLREFAGFLLQVADDHERPSEREEGDRG